VVPPGFREAMRDCEIQSYRVFFFEKRGDEFYTPPENYPREALACVSLHDLHTLAGWWSGHDIGVRQKIGLLADTEFPDAGAHRAHQRRRALGLLAEKGLMPAEMEPVLRGGEAPRDLPEGLAVAFHRLIARTPSRLVVVQAEELTGALDQVNIPGTTSEHANWRRKLAVDLKDLPNTPLFRAITAALREERPKGSYDALGNVYYGSR